MADTVQSIADLVAECPDNSAGAITPQIQRNLIVSAVNRLTDGPPARRMPYPLFTASGVDDEFDDGSFTGWTAVNDGTAVPTVTEANDVASVSHPGGGSAAHLYAYMKTATVNANDIIEICFSGFGVQQNFNICGLLMADGTTYNAGAQVAWSYSPSENATGGQNLLVAYTGYNANSAIVGLNSYMKMNDIFMRLKYEGSNHWRGYLSPDGVSWVDATGQRSSTMTPTKVGFFVTTWGGTAPFVWSMRYFRKTT